MIRSIYSTIVYLVRKRIVVAVSKYNRLVSAAKPGLKSWSCASFSMACTFGMLFTSAKCLKCHRNDSKYYPSVKFSLTSTKDWLIMN